MSELTDKFISCIRERRLPWRVSHALEQAYVSALKVVGADGLRVQHYHNEREAISFEREYVVKSLMAEAILSEFKPSSIIDMVAG